MKQHTSNRIEIRTKRSYRGHGSRTVHTVFVDGAILNMNTSECLMNLRELRAHIAEMPISALAARCYK